MGGPENPRRLRCNPQTYCLIDAKLLDHECDMSVTSDHLILRAHIAPSATAISTFILVDVVILFGCLFL